MDPLEGGMRHLQQIAAMSDRQAVLAKKGAALELTRIEGEIAVAVARAAVSEAEIATLKERLSASAEDQDGSATGHLSALLAAVTTEHGARLREIEALNSYLEAKREIAELSLEIDPAGMTKMISFLPGAEDDTGTPQA